jgi:predicted Zn finger-like uncharacterized protein
MFISCPNCSTRYNVTPAQIGVSGKSVKCSNCGNTWHQKPVADPPPPMRPAMQQPMHAPAQPQYAQPQQPYPYPPQGYPGYPPPPGYPPYPPQGYPPPGYPPPEGYPASGQPAAPAPQAPPPPPAPEPEPEEDEDIALPDMEDDDPMAAFATDDDDEGDADEDQLSSSDIEAMFGDDDDEPEPLGSMVDSGGDDDDDEDDGASFDDLEEPEPIPQVFTAEETGDDEFEDDDEDEDEHRGSSKGSLMKIIIAAVLVLLLGIIGALVFLKDTVIELVPATEGIYSMIGLGDDSLGAGLSINDVKSTRESISGKDVLVVRGVIANISDKERPVPMLELRLSDLDGKLVQSAKTTPLKAQLAAGDQIGFKIQVEDPSPLARRLEVTFIERGGEGHGEAKKPAH